MSAWPASFFQPLQDLGRPGLSQDIQIASSRLDLIEHLKLTGFSDLWALVCVYFDLHCMWRVSEKLNLVTRSWVVVQLSYQVVYTVKSSAYSRCWDFSGCVTEPDHISLKLVVVLALTTLSLSTFLLQQSLTQIFRINFVQCRLNIC